MNKIINWTCGKHQYHIDELFFIIVGFILGMLTIVRCFFGIELTDEAYYVADAYSVYQGNAIFAYNATDVAGMSLITLPFIWVFRLFSADNEGVFLYMRLCYTFFRFLIILLCYIFLKKRYARRALLPACTVLIAWTSYIPNFSYNTSPFWLILLSSVLLCVYCDNNDKKSYIAIFVAGALSALSVMAHPLQISAVIILGLLLIIYSRKNRKIIKALMYIAGGIILTLLVLLSIGIQVGFGSLFDGLNVMIFSRSGGGTSVDVLQRFIDFFIWGKSIYFLLFVVFCASMLVCVLINKIFSLHWQWVNEILISSVIALIFVVIRYGWNGAEYTLYYIGVLSFWILLTIVLLYKDTLARFVIYPYLFFFLCEVVFPSTGSAYSRTYFMYPAVFVFIIMLLDGKKRWTKKVNDKNVGMTLRIVALCFALVVSVIVIHCEYAFVYRDDPISQLNYRVNEGIYKGIYTSEERAKCTMEVEEYIKGNTQSGQLVSFRDNVPFGYLMSNGIMCDIRTWDAMQYSYVAKGSMKDNPNNMYKYYERTRSIPDKYIYIDCGRDDVLSCDNNDFKFNKWLRTYYNEHERKRVNDKYSVVVYRYNGTFDGNYDYWIESNE